jgi:hypothetical protein
LNDGSIEFCARLERKQFEQVVLIGAMRICEADAAHSVSRILVECTRGLISARLIESTLRNRRSRCVRSLRREENAQQLSSGRLGIAGQRNRKSETDCQDRAPTPAIEQNANQRLPPKNAKLRSTPVRGKWQQDQDLSIAACRQASPLGCGGCIRL